MGAKFRTTTKEHMEILNKHRETHGIKHTQETHDKIDKHKKDRAGS